MSNPLMSIMMNNTLKKQGIDTASTVLEGEEPKLNKKQEELLLGCLQKKSHSIQSRGESTNCQGGIKMVTLEQLKPPGKKEKNEPVENNTIKAQKTFVTLASIGKKG